VKSYIVDAFTTTPFTGNPAAVCLPDATLPDPAMQLIAMEFGLSETAFVVPTEQPDTFGIRFFSPKQEIPLCGHATLASAKIVFTRTHLDRVHFITAAGVDLDIERRGAEIVMTFPVYDTEPIDVPLGVLQALGVHTVVASAFSPNNKIILLQIEDTAKLAALTPDFRALVASYGGINGVLVTAAPADGAYDYHYRYFWPWAGTDEDPVTGGVQTFLAKYWAQRLGKTRMRAFQSSARTGTMSVELRDDSVLVCGQAVVMLEGSLTLGGGHGRFALSS
jgi:PhzF family phenazine biosynthesis protein